MKPNDYYFIRPYDQTKSLPPKENFSQILNETFLQPFNWRGRTTRNSFWLSTLVNAVLCALASGLLTFVLAPNGLDLGLKWTDGVIASVIYLVSFFASLGQLIRRLHDVNYSGYWFWLIFTGYGTYFLLYLTLQPSLQRPVKWGSYLFPYPEKAAAYYSQNYQAEMEQSSVPLESFTQILKEHFFHPFKWNARSTRESYWVGFIFSAFLETVTSFILFFMIICAGLTPAPHALNLYEGMPPAFTACILVVGCLTFILLIWAFLAQLGHAVRRLHDANLNGAWWLIGLLPYIGDILQSFLLFHPTVQHSVRWSGYLFKEKRK